MPSRDLASEFVGALTEQPASERTTGLGARQALARASDDGWAGTVSGEIYSVLFEIAVGENDRVPHPPRKVDIRVGEVLFAAVVDAGAWADDLCVVFADGSAVRLPFPFEGGRPKGATGVLMSEQRPEKARPTLSSPGRESREVEWKAGIDNDFMKDSVVKAIAAMANASGGIVRIGVDDAGAVIGIDAAVAATPKGRDGYRRVILDRAEGQAGASLPPLLRVEFEPAGQLTVCSVYVDPSPRPVWLKRETLPVRVDGKTMSLKGQDATEYVAWWFNSR